MKLIMILLMMIFLSSCNVPQVKRLELCTVSLKYYKCRCGMYDLNRHSSVGEFSDYPIEKCENLSGFHIKDWSEDIRPWGKRLRKFIKRNCVKK